ncbi:fimbrial protein [Pantoea agglomerans]|uniref:Uncharacterized protein n=1 Tax=Enterobacter agglomerans TaxID=549 RepID=A0ACC5RJW6_ENTAG|nr:hypothetical protein [Pantoea agglomerans]MBK4724975.1 hypothetical protein [Pantoea agglomerans]
MKRLVYVFCIFILTFINQGWATDINVHISGNVIFPPCKLSIGDGFEININKISENYNNENPVAGGKIIVLNCGYYTGTPYVSIDGDSLPGAPSHILRLHRLSDEESAIGVEFYQGYPGNGGIKILLGGDPYKNKITSGFIAGSQSQPQFLLTAVIFRLADKVLLPGRYVGTATMTISYL